ncbi:MAG TPA: MFS transporter, partial [Acidimicrobiales bacterium]
GLGVAVLARLDSQLNGALDRQLKARATEVARLAASTPQLLTEPGTLEGRLGGSPLLVQVIDPEDRIVARSSGLGSRVLPDAPVVERALEDRAAGYGDANLGADPLRVYAAPLGELGSGEAAGGAVVVAGTTTEIGDTLDETRRFVLLASLVAALIAAALATVLARRALRPLRRLSTGAREIERTGDASQRLPDPEMRDEVGALAETLNAMLASLERARAAEQRFVGDASHELRTPLTALRGNLAYATKHGADPEVLADIEADAARLGVLLDDLLAALADRRGRRRLLVVSLLSAIAATVAGALAPNLATLAATQVVNRGSVSAASVHLGVSAAGEMPAGARASALSLLAMTGALGAGMALWVLPVADVGLRAWRILYVVPLLFIPVVLRFGRLLPESRRYVRPHRTVGLAGHYHRLALLASSSFLLLLFTTPQSQFRTEFLRDERGMSAAAVSLFIIVTSTPASIGIVVGGRLADTRGRRVVGAVGTVVGVALLTLSFAFHGPAMWLTATVGSIFAAALVPALSVYGPELFPTSLRGRANGIINTVATVGSVIGLVLAGYLIDRLDSFGLALGLLAIGPLVMAAVVLAFFPETAWRELEDLNPEDRTAPPTVPTPVPLGDGRAGSSG